MPQRLAQVPGRVEHVGRDHQVKLPAGEPLVADSDGEWFEVLAAADFDLNGFQLGDDALAATPVVGGTDCVPVTAGTYLLFSQSIDPATNGMLPAVTAAFPTGVDLVNGAGTVQVGVGGVAIATQTWTASAAGTSRIP